MLLFLDFAKILKLVYLFPKILNCGLPNPNYYMQSYLFFFLHKLFYIAERERDRGICIVAKCSIK